MVEFNPRILSVEDTVLARQILGSHYGVWRLHLPDLVIAPDGEAYLYRWHVIPQNKQANVYLHVQVSSDPERPLHDHPWDNTSVIISGGYDEIWQPTPWFMGGDIHTSRELRAGNVVHRLAGEAHRLLLPPEFPYTMTLFSTGPNVRKWGFWYGSEWRPYTDVTRQEGNKSVHIKQEGSNENA